MHHQENPNCLGVLNARRLRPTVEEQHRKSLISAQDSEPKQSLYRRHGKKSDTNHPATP
jgi:hypothetical protein